MATVSATGIGVKPWSLGEGTSFMTRVKDLGPGAFVAATFIGSGDIATGGKAGVSMFRSIPKIGWFLALFIGLFGVYYGVGNVTSQFSASAWAVTGVFPQMDYVLAAGIVAVLCMALIWIGNYAILDKVMSLMLVAIIGSFFAAAFSTGVNLADAARG